jgi:hypothetical protein
VSWPPRQTEIQWEASEPASEPRAPETAAAAPWSGRTVDELEWAIYNIDGRLFRTLSRSEKRFLLAKRADTPPSWPTTGSRCRRTRPRRRR